MSLYRNHLTTTQANLLLTTLAADGFDPADFEWARAWQSDFNSAQWLLDAPTATVASIYTEGCALRSRREPSNYFSVRYSPGDPPLFGYGMCPAGTVLSLGDLADTFTTIEHGFRFWLTALKQEQVPDMWAAVARLPELTWQTTGTFSEAEARFLRTRLDELEGEIKSTKSLTGQQHQSLHEKVDYLKDAVGHLNRLDWKNAFLGVVVQMVVLGIVDASVWPMVVVPWLARVIVGEPPALPLP